MSDRGARQANRAKKCDFQEIQFVPLTQLPRVERSAVLEITGLPNVWRPGAAQSARPATVILTPQQADLATQKGEVLFDAVSKVAKDGGSVMTITSPAHVFDCPEESLFYSQCIEKMVLTTPDCHDDIVEFGAGDGSPVISALLKSPPSSRRKIHGYEIGPTAAALAAQRAQKFGLDQQYQVHNSCFWKGIRETPASCLIANPPYLPAPDDDIMMPELWGGVDGAELTRDLLSLGFERCMLMISAYSNPVLTLQHARDQGYAVVDFLVTPLPFGTYSSEPKVRRWINGMRERGEAFFSPRMYFLAGVLFEKQSTNQAGTASNGRNAVHATSDGVATAAQKKDDLFEELLQVLTAL
eukprot:gene5863-6104_t